MKEINPGQWERKEAYEFFSHISNPFFMVTFKIDVTELYNYTKARGLSFYKGMIWACTEAINQTPAFLVSVQDGRLVMIEGRNPSFTDLKPKAGQFHIVTMPHCRDIDVFCKEAARRSAEQEGFIDHEKETDDLIYYSCLPWVELTAMTNERDMSDPNALNDSVPRVAWGKYVDENGRKKLCVSLEVNHRFIDGIHIGQFAHALEEELEKLTP